MPYINQEQRDKLDVQIDGLAQNIRRIVNGGFDGPFAKGEDVNVAGVLNYCVTKLILKLFDSPKYYRIALITGVLENIKQEFYRRYAAPYEDEKIEENGDVY